MLFIGQYEVIFRSVLENAERRNMAYEPRLYLGLKSV